MNENEVLQDDEISLFDLCETLWKGWKTLVGATVLGIAVALGAIFIISPKYEAVAVVQVGQVGTADHARELDARAIGRGSAAYGTDHAGGGGIGQGAHGASSSTADKMAPAWRLRNGGRRNHPFHRSGQSLRGAPGRSCGPIRRCRPT